MINSSKEFEQIVYGKGNKSYLGKANIDLASGVSLPIENSDIWDGGIQITEQTSNSGSFDIGFCACNQAVIKLNNTEDKYSAYDFNNAVIRPCVGLQLSKTVEYLKRGVFTVDLPEQVGSYISLTCMDYMYKLDKKITNLIGSTAGIFVGNICTACGVSLKSARFDGYNRELTLPSNITEYTYRQALGFICQAIGAFARFDGDGLLEIKWYDTGAFETGAVLNGGTFDNATPYASGDTADGGDFTFSETTNFNGGTFTDMKRYHHIYSLQSMAVATDDVVITGIRVTNDNTTYLSGSEDYALEIADNPFTVGIEEEIAVYLGSRIIGMRFRPLSVTARSNPLIEAGDPAYISDRKGNSYICYITNYNFAIRQNMQIACDAATPQANSLDGLSPKIQTIIQARKIVKQEISSYDLAVQQLTNLMAYSFGVYKTEEKQPDGSIIYYMHNKPTLAESQTIWKMTADAFAVSTDGGQTWNAGFDSSGNAILNVLSAIGVNADWIKVLTYFTVGDKFSVDSTGHLKAVDADLSGKITAESGTIAGMDITSTSLERTYQVDTGNGTQNYTTKLGFSGNFFSISTENQDNTLNGGMNVSINDDGTPEMNIYVRDANGLRDDQIFLNGQPILNKVNDTYDQLWKLIDFCIQKFGYNPES
jgi:hypothetical protein